MNLFMVAALVILLIIHIVVQEFYLKRHLHIKNKRIGLFSKGRKTYSIIIEIITIILFAISYLNLNTGSNADSFSTAVKISPLFGLFFVLYLYRAIEEWFINRDEKSHYYYFLGSFMLTVSFVIIFVGDRL